MLLLQALAYHLVNQEQEALGVLLQAVSFAEPEGYIRRFVDEGRTMVQLLGLLKEQEAQAGPTPYLDTLLAAFPGEGPPWKSHPEHTNQHVGHIMPQPLLDPLSERELDVLYLLARGASNQDIAEELAIAVNTVKHHVSTILSKLVVSNRTQAVAQARSLGLFPDEL